MDRLRNEPLGSALPPCCLRTYPALAAKTWLNLILLPQCVLPHQTIAFHIDSFQCKLELFSSRQEMPFYSLQVCLRCVWILDIGAKDQRVVLLEAFNHLSALPEQTRDAGKACECIAQLDALKPKLKGLERARQPKNSKHIGWLRSALSPEEGAPGNHIPFFAQDDRIISSGRRRGRPVQRRSGRARRHAHRKNAPAGVGLRRHSRYVRPGLFRSSC